MSSCASCCALPSKAARFWLTARLSWRSSLLLLTTRSGNSSGSRRALTLDDCAAVPATIRRETSMLRERASVRWKDFRGASKESVTAPLAAEVGDDHLHGRAAAWRDHRGRDRGVESSRPA